MRWKQCLQTLAALGVTEFAELGPGGVLTGMAKRSVDGAARSRSPRPEDLDKLLEWVGGRHRSASCTPRASTCSRSSASSSRPAAGIFTPVATRVAASMIDVGTLLGHVGEHEVRSPFRGVLQSFIAVDTERVTPRQPIAWLRSD